jgi:hypothetical protein
MSLEPIGVVTLIVGLATLRFGARMAIYAFVPATLLGAAGAILLGASGTIQPAHLLLGFVAPIALSQRRSYAIAKRSLTFPNEGFWLAALACCAVVGAIFLPRLLAGVTQVNAIGETDYGVSFELVPLGPTSGNFTQPIYVCADVVCFITMLGFVRSEDDAVTLTKALLAYAVANIFFAIVDLVTFWTHTGYLLGFIRNAQYAFHLDESSVGLKRIAGSFTETSAFSYATLGSLAFTGRLWLSGLWPRLTSLLTMTSLVFLILSTSTTAIAAAPVVLCYLYFVCLAMALTRRHTPQSMAFVVILPLIVAASVIALAMDKSALITVRDYLNTVVFDKSTSDSGVSREGWNAQAFQNFIDTWGLGGGLGSIRASSFALALLSNLGLAGVALFAPFFCGLFFFKRGITASPQMAVLRAAARAACFALLVAACVSGTLVDLGLPFFIFAALACAEPVRRPFVARMGALARHESLAGSLRPALPRLPF